MFGLILSFYLGFVIKNSIQRLRLSSRTKSIYTWKSEFPISTLLVQNLPKMFYPEHPIGPSSPCNDGLLGHWHLAAFPPTIVLADVGDVTGGFWEGVWILNDPLVS